MATRLTFLLDGRDHLSRVLDGAGDAATRLSRRLLVASINGDAAMRRLGSSTTQRMAGMQRDQDLAARATKALTGALISMAPAAIPMVASLAPIAPAVGAAAVATAAYGAALGPQIAAMSEASQAEKAYTDTVEKSGRTSEETAKAQVEYQRVLAGMPPATRRAAAGLSVLKDEYKDWSDGLAEDTLSPVNKAMALFSAALPATTGLVKGASEQLDRMMTILAGGMEAPGLDGLNQRFTEFATGTLRRVNDALVRLMRTTDTGKVGGGLSEFMDFARAQGPVVAETMRNVGRALINVLQAGSDVGVGLLDVVNGLTSIIAAVPPGAIAAMLQLAIAIKAVKLAAVGIAAARTAMAAFAVQLLAMQTAAGAAPGRLAAVTAAIGAMSRGAKLAVAGTGIGLLVLALAELASMGDSTPPDVDKLTSSLSNLGQTGRVTGEAAKVFGADFGKLKTQINEMTDPSVAESVNNWGHNITGGMLDAGDATKKATESFKAVDESLAGMVKGGKADLAKAALERMLSTMDAGQVKTLTGSLDEYDAALADMKFEQDLTAASMGLFGAQAQSVQAKLDAQKQSTDGLRQSIMALNEVNRAALDGRAGMEAAIDAAAAATTKYKDALHITRGELDLNSKAARDAQGILTELARKTEGNVSAARDSGKSWEYAKGQYDRGRTALIQSADAMGLNKDEARKLADQILKTPNKTAYLKGNLSDLEAKLADAKARLARAPSSKTAKIKGEISDLRRKIGQAKSDIASLHGKTVTITTKYVVVGDGSAGRKQGSHGSQLKLADGGLVGFPGGGPVRGPGTGRSDSILARVSNGEYVVQAASVDRYGVGLLDAINAGRLGTAAPAAQSAPMAVSRSGSAGGSGTVIHNHYQVDVHGAMDPVAVGREFQKVLVKFGRAQGSTVDLKLR